MKIPKKIWTFWNSEKLPVTIDNCIKTWEFFNPNYEINIINLKNVDKFLPKVGIKKLHHGKESYAKLSDFIRLNLLSKHGGIWLDASVICTESFDVWIDRVANKDTEFIGFYNTNLTSLRKYKVIENWTFACVKGCKLVKKWCKEFMSLEKYDYVSEWLDEKEKQGVDFQNIPEQDDLEYLSCHVALLKVLQVDKYPQSRMKLIKANTTALKYLTYNSSGLSNTKKVKRLCDDYDYWAVDPIIKFVSFTRDVIDRNEKIRNCIFNNWKNKIATILTGIKT